MTESSLPSTFASVPNYGTGRIIRQNDDGSFDVAFLDVPGVPPIEINSFDVRLCGLQNDTRVWIEPGPDSAHWRAGRIGAERDTGSTYWVLLPNSVTERIDELRIWTRWEREPSNLIAMLENLVSETPHLYISRLDAVRALMKQFSRTAGLTGLWSSLVELHEHQIEVARRVLTDPVPRYLLADEVGLGKTIEAGLIIRQHLVDNANARVLVLVPSHLIGQWTQELTKKFLISDFGLGRVRVAAHDDFVAYQTDYSMVVVDEVHRLTRHPLNATPDEDAIYSRLVSVCHSAPHLLLLTATPVRAQGNDYLAILHLLDPSSHPLLDTETFNQKLAMRGEIAEMLLGFDENMPPSFVEDYVKHFRKVISDDVNLAKKLDNLEQLANNEEDIASAVRSVKSHIAHRYRLHSRMIRNRRQGRLLQQFPVRGRRLSKTISVNATQKTVPNALDELRSYAGDMDSLSSDAIVSIRDVLSLLQTGHWPADQCREKAVLYLNKSLVSKCELAVQQDKIENERIAAIIDYCDQLRTPSGGRHNEPKVIFSTSPTFADAIANAFRDKWGPLRVVRLAANSDPLHTQTLIDSFRSLTGNAFLVCDATVEEGVNLQFADLVILADLPMLSGSLEQRIGRFDRFSLSIRPVEFAVVTSDSPFEALWFDYLNTTGIFSDSVANLQFALSVRDDDFVKSWLTLGPVATNEIIAGTPELISNEKKEIAKQDLLDSSELSEEINPFMRSLKLAERELAGCGKAIVTWAGDLGFKDHSVRNEAPRIFKGLTILSKPRRGGLLFNASVAMRLRPDQWENKLCIDRGQAIDHGDSRLLGVGNPVIDAIFDFTRNDERGRVCARLIKHPKAPPGSTILFADLHFLIEPNFDEIEKIAKEFGLESRALNTQCRQWFPTVMVPYYLDAKGTEVADQIRKIIDNPYDSSDPLDINLGGSGYDTFVSLSGDMNWVEYCRLMEHKAQTLCAMNEEVANARTTAISAARQHFHDRRVVAESRIDAGMESEPLALLDALSSQIFVALSEPKQSLDCVRVTFIQGPIA
jgi:ATP-dependent helicase HepA